MGFGPQKTINRKTKKNNQNGPCPTKKQSQGPEKKSKTAKKKKRKQKKKKKNKKKKKDLLPSLSLPLTLPDSLFFFSILPIHCKPHTLPIPNGTIEKNKRETEGDGGAAACLHKESEEPLKFAYKKENTEYTEGGQNTGTKISIQERE